MNAIIVNCFTYFKIRPHFFHKNKSNPIGLLCWLGMKDLNPHKQSQSLSCCHYTNPQYFVLSLCDVCYYIKVILICQVYFYKKTKFYTTFLKKGLLTKMKSYKLCAKLLLSSCTPCGVALLQHCKQPEREVRLVLPINTK